MYNYIDKQFFQLIDDIKSKNKMQIYSHMLEKFKSVPILTQVSIQLFLNKFNYWGKIEIENSNYEMIENKAEIFAKRIDEYVELYNNLSDYKSKYILFSILNNFYNFDFTNLKNCMEHVFKHYFDLDLIDTNENEVFVDVGAFTGDSTIDFISSFGENSYKKILCYEICKENIEKMQKILENYKNIYIFEKAITNFNGTTHFNKNADLSTNSTNSGGELAVEAVTLDADIKDKITMIKMDIEGGEMNALIGMENHIKNNTPKLLISVYHNNTDLLDIPKYISTINKNYNYHLRYYGNQYFPTEIVLLALPKQL